MNKIVIDGYNMIHGVPQLRRFLEVSLERSRDELIRLLKSYLSNKRVEVSVVFDGDLTPAGVEPFEQNRSLRVVFSQYPIKADQIILDLISKEKHKKGMIIVSDDSEILQHARSHETLVLSTRAFYDRLVRRFQSDEISSNRDKELSQEELAEWLAIFGKE